MNPGLKTNVYDIADYVIKTFTEVCRTEQLKFFLFDGYILVQYPHILACFDILPPQAKGITSQTARVIIIEDEMTDIFNPPQP